MNYEQHPIGAVLPPLTVQERDALKRHIDINGQLTPIILYEGKILAGWHRELILRELGIEPKYVTPPISDPYSYVLDEDHGRRNLSAQKRAMLAARLHKLQHGSNQYVHKVESTIVSSTFKNTREGMAKAAKISLGGIDRAKCILSNGTDEVVKAADEEKILLHHGEEICKLPKDQQATALQEAIEHKRTQKNLTNPKKSKKRGSKMIHLPPPIGPVKFAITAEDGFPVNGTTQERDAYYQKYGRTPLFAKDVKDIMNQEAAADTYAHAILHLTNDQHPSAEVFFAAIDAMLAWVPKPEKGSGWETNYAARARKHLEMLEERLPKALLRVAELDEQLRKRTTK